MKDASGKEQTRLRLRAGVGCDHSEPAGWFVVIQLWLEPDMEPNDAITAILPEVFATEDAALCKYMDDVRPNVIEPILERAKASGLTLEVLTATVEDIKKATAEAAQETKQ